MQVQLVTRCFVSSQAFFEGKAAVARLAYCCGWSSSVPQRAAKDRLTAMDYNPKFLSFNRMIPTVFFYW